MKKIASVCGCLAIFSSLLPGNAPAVKAQSCNYYTGVSVTGEKVTLDTCSISRTSDRSLNFVYYLGDKKFASQANCTDRTWIKPPNKKEIYHPQSQATKKMLDRVCNEQISSNSSGEEKAEPDELICKHEMKEIVVTKQQCTQLRTVLKDIEMEFDRIIASKKLSLKPTPVPRNNIWYYSGEDSGKYGGMVYYHSYISNFTTDLSKDNKVFSAGSGSGDGVIVFSIQLALTSHEIPIFDKPPFIEPSSSEYFLKGSIRIRGVDATPAKALIHLQKLLDELKKL